MMCVVCRQAARPGDLMLPVEQVMVGALGLTLTLSAHAVVHLGCLTGSAS